MLFNSAEFLVFLPVVLALYYGLPRRGQNALLLVASYVFYGAWDWRFLFLLVGSSLVDYLCTRSILQGRRRRVMLLISLGVNLGALGILKYANFFVDSLRRLLEGAGLQVMGGVYLDVVLPIGISFYTFQTLSFTIDAYRGRVQELPPLLNYLVFVGYFPQLVAGPIERASQLLPQLAAPRAFQWEGAAQGASLVVLGLLKKVVLADTLAAPYANLAFGAPQDQPGWFLWVGLFAFSLQIYGDFSGYSTIARGVSKILGIELTVNFRQPYLSRSITEFWRRWHVSLSSWLRDYLYIPLGGNRIGNVRTYVNLMLTMLIGGLWHGAAWGFVVWGGLHGVYLAVHKWSLRGRKVSDTPARDARGFLRALPAVVGTNLLVLVTWVFFRATSFSDALAYLRGLGSALTSWNTCLAVVFGLVGFLGVVLVVDLYAYRRGDDQPMLRGPPIVRGLLYGIALLLIWVSWPTDYAPFIYFQF